MKKFLISLLCIFGITPNVLATAGTVIPTTQFINLVGRYDFSTQQGISYMRSGKCQLKQDSDRDDEYLHVNDTDGVYEADNADDCPNNTEICVLGYSTVKNDTKNNACWRASAPTGWHEDKWVLSSNPNFKDCSESGGNWTIPSPDKIPVFVTKQNKILLHNTDMIKTLVGRNVAIDFGIKCIAYICDATDQHGTRFSYGCQDGSCEDGCPNDNNNNSNDDNTNGNDGNGDNGDNGGESGGGTTPTSTDVVHMNTVVPYMDALKSCAGK